MFVKLVRTECKQTGKSLIYWIYILCILLFFFSQMGDPSFVLVEPIEGKEETYSGITAKSKDKTLIMESTLGELALSYVHEYFVTYPVGFVKDIELTEGEMQTIKEILEQSTGRPISTINEEIEAYYRRNQNTMIMNGEFFLKPDPTLTFDQFEKNMKQVCDILGPGSSYDKSSYRAGVRVPASFEEAKKEYDNFVEEDRFTGGYARLFSDYMGIMLAILPVFVAVTRCLRDRRANMKDLIYTRASSSGIIILSRYVAMVLMSLLPVILASLCTLIQCISYTNGRNIQIDYFAFIPYIFGWLLPNILVALSVGMFLTELTDTAAAILIQGAWWFFSVFTARDNYGTYIINLVLRHNSVLGYQQFRDSLPQIIINRVMYSVFAIILLILTILVYELKRKGRLDLYGKIFGNRQRKSAA